MKHLQINKPCSENWDGMTPTEKGAFCQKCCKQVIDFTKQSIPEIRSILYANKGSEVCARIENTQLETLNQNFEAWRRSNQWSIQRASFYAFLFVFGLSIVSCSTSEEQSEVARLQEAAMSLINKADKNPEQLIVLDKAPTTQTEKLCVIEEEEIKPAITILIDAERDFRQKTTEHRDSLIVPEIERCTYVTMGAIVYTERYEEHLEKVVPEEELRYDENGVLIPEEFDAMAYPNPTSGRTTLKFEVPEKTKVSFALYSAGGAHIRSLGSADYEPGTYEIPFDLSRLTPGNYFITIISPTFKKSVRVSKT